MRCQHISDQLVRTIISFDRVQSLDGKYLVQIAIRFHHRDLPHLEVGLRQLRFDQEIAELHVNFGSVYAPAPQRNSRLEPELWSAANFRSQQCAQSRFRQRFRVTENIHQQRIRTHARVQFPPSPFRSRQRPRSMAVNFVQPAFPFRPLQNRPIRALQKIAVFPQTRRRLIHNHRLFAIAENVGQTPRPSKRSIARTQLLPQLRRITDQLTNPCLSMVPRSSAAPFLARAGRQGKKEQVPAKDGTQGLAHLPKISRTLEIAEHAPSLRILARAGHSHSW